MSLIEKGQIELPMQMVLNESEFNHFQWICFGVISASSDTVSHLTAIKTKVRLFMTSLYEYWFGLIRILRYSCDEARWPMEFLCQGCPSIKNIKPLANQVRSQIELTQTKRVHLNEKNSNTHTQKLIALFARRIQASEHGIKPTIRTLCTPNRMGNR